MLLIQSKKTKNKVVSAMGGIIFVNKPIKRTILYVAIVVGGT